MEIKITRLNFEDFNRIVDYMQELGKIREHHDRGEMGGEDLYNPMKIRCVKSIEGVPPVYEGVLIDIDPRTKTEDIQGLVKLIH